MSAFSAKARIALLLLRFLPCLVPPLGGTLLHDLLLVVASSIC